MHGITRPYNILAMFNHRADQHGKPFFNFIDPHADNKDNPPFFIVRIQNVNK
jgi:hypothetical protein